MPRENYRRIRHGYEPHEPTNTFSFYKRKPVLKENRIRFKGVGVTRRDDRFK